MSGVSNPRPVRSSSSFAGSGPRAMKKLTGRDPQTGNGIEPIEIWAHQPKMMIGMGKFNQAIRKGKTVDERIKNWSSRRARK